MWAERETVHATEESKNHSLGLHLKSHTADFKRVNTVHYQNTDVHYLGLECVVWDVAERSSVRSERSRIRSGRSGKFHLPSADGEEKTKHGQCGSSASHSTGTNFLHH